MLIWLWTLVTFFLLVDALRARGKVASIPVLEPSEEPASEDHVFLLAPDVELDEPTRRAASAHARAGKLGVLDLLPRDMGALAAWGLLQFLDPERYRKDTLGKGISAGHAALVTRDVLRRAGVAEGRLAGEAAFVRTVARLKWYASASTDVAIAPSLRAVPSRRPLAVLRERHGSGATFVLAGLPFVLAIVLLAAIRGSWPGLSVLIAFQLQPLLAFAGGRLRPGGLVFTVPFRWLLDLWAWLRLLFERSPAVDPAAVADKRPEYDRLVAGGLDAFFEPRRTTCPLCGAEDLRPILRTGDLLQGKPGRFTIERCGACGHRFQNPRLSLQGLEYYYKDFYDGLGGDEIEDIFGASLMQYHQRAEFVQGVTTPGTWLDVGGGHGHFCRVARDRIPGARFDALDLSDAILDAERRGWVDRGIRGLFPETAPELAGRYDVVSMSHYLEHTREPEAEIAAAAIALREGGHLMIELPDPDCFYGKILGRLWLPFFQPQHQHLLSTRALEKLLRAHGFDPLKWHRGEAHQRIDLFAATILFIHWIAPRADVPWRPSSAARRFFRKACFALLMPWLLLARVADNVLGPFIERLGGANTYRVVARLSAPRSAAPTARSTSPN